MKKILIISLLSFTYQVLYAQNGKRVYIESDGIAIPGYEVAARRPAINTVLSGNLIYNQYEKIIQFSDGTKWNNIHGKNSLPGSSINRTIFNNGDGWVNANVIRNNGINVWLDNQLTPLNSSDIFSVSGNIAATSEDGVAIWGISTNGVAISGTSENGSGIKGVSETDKGVWSFCPGNIAVRASSVIGLAVRVFSDSNYSAKFEGRMLMQSGYPYAGVDFENTNESIRGYLGMRDDNEMGIYGYGLIDWVQRWNINTGTICLSGNPTICSDFRLKKGFQKLNNSIKLIGDLDGYNYYFKNEKNKNIQTGFIAQEIQKILPELVKIDEKGFLSVDYIGLIPHLLEAEKSLKRENEELEKENEILEMRLLKIISMQNIHAVSEKLGK